MLRLDPTVIRVTTSDVKLFEHQQKTEDRSRRGTIGRFNPQPCSNTSHHSQQLGFLQHDAASAREVIETYTGSPVLDPDNDDIVVIDDDDDDDEKTNRSSSGDGSRTRDGLYNDLTPSLSTSRLPLPLPFSATTRVTTSTNQPGNVHDLAAEGPAFKRTKTQCTYGAGDTANTNTRCPISRQPRSASDAKQSVRSSTPRTAAGGIYGAKQQAASSPEFIESCFEIASTWCESINSY
ncbi:hypothetical protein CORC01_04297 [Colletotrichum orchidophilum]|uniref:Uncharacterized protein n=1 Tax=Colletotrichum orchidophilum TaxID=1209926 RepID=A0A1G4BG34_9PEZI|nr:uncharacterized protein CORC01_04297 [Colletotrichum orchidophilum]OHF00316.1 hypothetical protein CORC01_04297 [Colletotrichum orchidophilum]